MFSGSKDYGCSCVNTDEDSGASSVMIHWLSLIFLKVTLKNADKCLSSEILFKPLKPLFSVWICVDGLAFLESWQGLLT